MIAIRSVSPGAGTMQWGMKELPGEMEMFYIFIGGGGYTTVYIYQKSPWLVWLSGLSASLQTKGLPVLFPVRAHAWVRGWVPWGWAQEATTH